MEVKEIMNMVNLALVLMVLGVIIGMCTLTYAIYVTQSVEPKENLKEYGLQVTNQEIECWKACGKQDNYFYDSGSFFTSSVCECGIIK